MTESWDTIADWYTDLVRADSAMHEFNREILLEHLPEDLSGQRVLDLGCGEGIITRAVAARGAVAVGIDASPRMVENAEAVGAAGVRGSVRYSVDDGCVLGTVATGSVDWVTAGLSLNNVPDLDAALGAVRRVLVARGVLVFTVPHPCFEAPHASWLRDEGGGARRVVGGYFAEGFWRSEDPGSVRRAGNHHRMISTYVGAMVGGGFEVEAVAEPAPGVRLAADQPRRAELPPFLVVRARRG
ncbi:MAG: methyltransferase domain-containing protein [Catenulispora sp.]|nr:methyltransferase domain-containing protein [Catenulispora sp.]